ncbi:TIMM13 [Bugula neritina]|uniref:Mitochondrial import inner membrane translocase subunit n=1 Tax=Bugula neritina TaxID=10212 RepID=A0A7J7K754_BUGNE|nr:TIMM13 [Bugula neritina]
MSNSMPMDNAQRQQIMEQVNMQVEMAKLKQLLEGVQDKCFKMCVSKPGSSLASSEQKCLGQCMDRYLDAVQVVEKTYINRLQQEGGGASGF